MQRISKLMGHGLSEENAKDHHKSVTFTVDEWEWNRYEQMLSNGK